MTRVAYREILALGNPLVWWPGLVALVVLAVAWWRARWPLDGPEPVILAAAISTFLPWLVLSGDRSQTFLWYFLPTVPFLGLAIGVLAAWAWQRMAGRVAVVAYGLLVAGELRVLRSGADRPSAGARRVADAHPVRRLRAPRRCQAAAAGRLIERGRTARRLVLDLTMIAALRTRNASELAQH